MAPLRWAVVCMMTIAANPAWARVAEERPGITGAPALCLAAADRAAAEHGIPPQMMRAITLVETRRTVAGATGPWP